MTTPPFDQTETLAHELAIKHGLTWKEQVSLEAAMNNLYYELGKPSMLVFVNALKDFVNDLLENVYVD